MDWLEDYSPVALTELIDTKMANIVDITASASYCS